MAIFSDLAICGPIEGVLAKGSLNRFLPSVADWLTSAVTLARLVLTTGFLLCPADDRRVSPIPHEQISMMGDLCYYQYRV